MAIKFQKTGNVMIESGVNTNVQQYYSTRTFSLDNEERNWNHGFVDNNNQFQMYDDCLLLQNIIEY